MMLLSDAVHSIGSVHGFQGFKKISGQVLEQGNPLPCLIKVHEKISGVLVAHIPSDQNGKYEIVGLSDNFKYYVVSHHPKSQFNAVIQDNVVPK